MYLIFMSTINIFADREGKKKHETVSQYKSKKWNKSLCIRSWQG